MAAATGTREAPVRALPSLAPWAVGLLAGLVYAAISLTRLRRLETRSWDLAIFEQAIDGYARLQAPIVDVKGPGYHILGDHFSPVTALLAPFWQLWSTPVTLLVAQAVLLALSVVVIGRLAVRHLGPAAGLAVAVAYALSFGLVNAADVDFHEIAFGVLFLALAGAAYVERDWRRVALWSVAMMLVKEDLGFTVVAVGAAVALVGARRWGVGLAVLGAVGAVVVLLVVIPSFNTGGGYDYYASSGLSDGGVWTTLRTEAGTKAWTVVATLGVTGLLALGSPWVLVVVPTLAWRFVGATPYYWGTDWHYSAVLMPVVFVALVDACVRLRARGPGWLRTYVRAAPAVALVVAVVSVVSTPVGTLASASTWAASPRTEAAEGAVDAVPEGASVESDIGLLALLAVDRDAYWIGTVGPVVPDYVVVDDWYWGGTPPADAAVYGEQQHPGAAYRVVYDVGGYSVAERVG